MPDNPLATAADAVADAAAALDDAAADASKEVEPVAQAPVVVIERASEPVAPPEPAAMQPHEHPEISTALEDIRKSIGNLAPVQAAEGAADLTEGAAADATAPVAAAVDPVAQSASDAAESAPKRVHALFRPLFGGKG